MDIIFTEDGRMTKKEVSNILFLLHKEAEQQINGFILNWMELKLHQGEMTTLHTKTQPQLFIWLWILLSARWRVKRGFQVPLVDTHNSTTDGEAS